MEKKYSSDQENFWAGDFGNDYASRNMGKKFLAAQINYFSKILEKTNNIDSVIEFGANIGVNLQAIHFLLPESKLAAVEINESAVRQISQNVSTEVEVFKQSFFDFEPKKQWDFSFVKGVLIHLNPEKLKIAYQILYSSSKKYICIGEYYNPNPVSVDYRGHKNRLFKRDFCGEFIDQFPEVKLIDYGFCYHKDNNFPQDDINWFLLKK